MSAAPDAFEQRLQLRDGTPVRVRAARPEDRQRIVDFFEHLEAQTIYTRFFGPRKQLTDKELGTIDQNDFVARTILLATVGDAPDETVIAAGSYVVDPPSGSPPRSAEMAFTVEEDFQGQGLAGHLLRALIGIAREHGLERLTAEVLSHNAPMLAVFRRAGLPMHSRSAGGVVQLSLDLRATRA